MFLLLLDCSPTRYPLQWSNINLVCALTSVFFLIDYICRKEHREVSNNEPILIFAKVYLTWTLSTTLIWCIQVLLLQLNGGAPVQDILFSLALLIVDARLIWNVSHTWYVRQDVLEIFWKCVMFIEVTVRYNGLYNDHRDYIELQSEGYASNEEVDRENVTSRQHRDVLYAGPD